MVAQFRGTLIALLAGGLGAGLWALIAWKLHLETGIVAWGIGVAVGFGMMIGAGTSRNAMTGIAAVLIALLSIAAGKYGAVYAVSQRLTASAQTNFNMSPENGKIRIADEMIAEQQAAGKAIIWRNGATGIEDADELADYPPDIEQAAVARWESMPQAEQDAYLQKMQQSAQSGVKSMLSELRWLAFKKSFSFFDILWAVLAVVSAWRLGADSEAE